MSEPPAELPVPEGMPAEASEAVPEAEMAQPVEPEPESHKRELEDKLIRMSKRQSSKRFGWTNQASQSFLIASWFGLKTRVF